ncbi:helicase-like transcription factor CHR27 [Brassica rapa]|uniref:helicase-like transcription factor CHR27 n=1 Tax=Brassica campestris TaxID=3711 RepID=UPI0004F1789D|nr:helicase-like transcription factor CHR27 [Brassica rapa]XP_033135039.1 helicase-like transcription factor CHR27 [Brassica rapa]
MMDSDIQISSGSSSSSSSNCSGSGSDDELIGKETSGSSSFTSSAGNSQDSAGCTNHASPSGNGVRILPPSSMTHGTSASPLHGPSDPVDMTGNEIGEDKNSERLIYQDALQNLNQPRTEVDLPPGTLSVPLMRHQKIALAWMLRKETTCLDCSGGILAADQGLGKTVSMIALILKQKYESQLKSEITSKQESEILDLDADDDESENAKHDESGSHARPPELKVSSDSETIVLLSDDENGSSDMENAKDEEARELNSNKRPAAGTLVVCPASVVTQWVRELDEKVSDESKLSVLVYHGGNRTKDPSVLAKYDVVITTYAIVTNEVPKQFLLDEDEDENDDSHSFSNSKKRKVSVSASKNRGSFGGTLSRVGWLRVVLDEAQTIKNHRIQVARACRILRAKRRWCLSGAPIQNTVDDLYSYFRAHEGEEPPSQEPIKTLVFSQWNGMLDLVELCFVENGIEFRRLDGTMSLAARDRAVKEFSNDPDVEVMLMSLKAGNLGLNMVAASHVVSSGGEKENGCIGLW